MYKWAGILFLMLLLSISSCRQHEMPVPDVNSPLQLNSEAAVIRTFDAPVVVFIYPDESHSDSLRKALGDDQYFALSDKNGAEFSKIRQLAAKENLTSWSGNPGKYRFITHEGAIIEIDLGLIALPWKVLLFNGKDAPLLASTSDAQALLVQTFNLRPSKKIKQAYRKSSADYGVTEISKPALHEKEISELNGLKETTIRLVIFPGQAPPPLRNDASGIRVVNSYISPNKRFWLYFDNDMFSNTDRYYTNGVVLGYTAPGLTNWGLNRLMIRQNRNSVVHSSLSLHHAMFTPLTTKEQPTLSNDRPYASSLFIRYSQTSEDASAGIRLTSALDAGVIGNAALGNVLQRSVHATIPTNDEPLGWETQIKNDLVLNYYVNLQKQLLKSKQAEVYAEGSVNAGSLHTNASIGINAITGKFIPGITPLPDNYNQLTNHNRQWQYGIRGGLELRMIGYDATLQGGLFNRDNVYALKPDEIERLVAAMHVGLFANYRKLNLSISQYYLSREFREGRQHFWGQIGIALGW